MKIERYILSLYVRLRHLFLWNPIWKGLVREMAATKPWKCHPLYSDRSYPNSTSYYLHRISCDEVDFTLVWSCEGSDKPFDPLQGKLKSFFWIRARTSSCAFILRTTRRLRIPQNESGQRWPVNNECWIFQDCPFLVFDSSSASKSSKYSINFHVLKTFWFKSSW